MRREILKWLSDFRSQIERCIGRYIQGYFFKRSFGNKSSLPAIEVYSFKGIPKTKAKFLSWVKSASPWLESLGFYLFSYKMYSDGKVIYVPLREKDYFGISYAPVSRLMIHEEQYLQTIDIRMFGNDKRLAMAENSQEVLTLLLPYLVIDEILIVFQQEFEEIRNTIFRSMKKSGILFYWLGRLIKLNDVLLRLSVSHDRISKELQLEQKWIAKSLQEVEDLKVVESLNKNRPALLGDALKKSVDARLDLLTKHISIAHDWFTQYLALRTIAVTYILAVVAGITAIISVILALPK